jgi:cytochrome P450
MDTQTNQQKPLSFEGCQVEILRDPKKPSFFSRLGSFFSFVISLPKRFHNTYLVIRHKEMIYPTSKNVCPFRAFTSFSSIFFTFKATCIPELMKAILKPARNDPEKGMFVDKENQYVLFAVAKDLYPAEKIEINDSIFTCHKDFLIKYRQPILQFIGPNHVKERRENLVQIATEVIQNCPTHKQINATELAFIFTTNVISKLLLGHPGPFETYKQISLAFDCINRLLLKKIWRQPLSSHEKKNYDDALGTIRQAIDTSLTTHSNSPSFLKAMEEKNLSPIQIKISLFNMYFAGSETSASLLSYLLWQLGKHPEYQEEIYRDIIKEGALIQDVVEDSLILNLVFAESIRLFTPAYLGTRRPAGPLICRIKNANGDIVFEEKIKKHEVFATAFACAGKDPSRFENPNQFHPRRFTTSPSLDWKPFGDGAHTCPGQWLAKSEILIFVGLLIKRFRFTSLPEKEPQQKGLITNKLSETIWISLRDCR